MKHQSTNAWLSGTLGLVFAIAANLAFAQAENFVDEASAKGIAEIETARLALDKTQAQDIKDFANQMIEDHTKANQKLAEVASKKNLEMSDEATLMAKAKALILQVRDGEDFNAAYANNQVVAHEQTIELFREYVKNGQNADLKQYAESTLPTLEKHLQHAKELQGKYAEQD